jgi:hypothetical protein
VEKTIFIQASLFTWSPGAAEFLLSWIEDGGILVLSLDRVWVLEEKILAEFLRQLEIGVTDSWGQRSYHYHSAEPDLDRNLVFEVPPENQNALVMRDSGGSIRLVQIRYGEGKLTVTGGVWFMNNYNLRDVPNARLAWNLLAESSGSRAGEPGVFFIRNFRDRDEAGLFGRLFERGNFFAPLFSGVLLIVLGFWAALSLFGVVRGDDARPGKPLRERFLAEGRFLKRFGALDSYLAAYRSEIRRKFLKRKGVKDEDEIILLSASLLKEAGREDTIETVRQAFSPHVRGRDFRKTVILLRSILERL